MSDQQESTSSTQPASDERPQQQQQQQQKTNQPEQRGGGGGGHRGGGGGERDRDRGGRRRHPQNQPGQQQQQQQRRPEPALNLEELRELVELIAQHGFTDFELEREGIRVRLRRDVASQNLPAPIAATAHTPSPVPSVPQAVPVAAAREAQPSAPPQAAPAAEEAAKAAAPDEDVHIITSPIVGTFYRSPSPTAEPFVRLGSQVHQDTVVCIIEAMKLMNEIQAETSGEVVKIYVENNQPVEYGQPLFGIKK